MSLPVGPVEEQYKTPSGSGRTCKCLFVDDGVGLSRKAASVVFFTCPDPSCSHRTGPAPVNVAEYEAYAKDNMPRIIHGYYASGANDMITLRENRAAFSRLRLMPKILVDVTHVNTETTILGDRVASPILVAPSAMQRMAHDHGECATAKAAARMNTLMTLSSWSTIALEEVANSAPGGLRWFQLYVYKDRKVTMDLVKRAEKAGYKAFAVTVDTPQVRHLRRPPGRGTTTPTGWHLPDCCFSHLTPSSPLHLHAQLGRREADVRNKFALPAHLTMGNFAGKGGDHASGTKTAGDKGSGLASYVASLIDQTLTWKDIAWLRQVPHLSRPLSGPLIRPLSRPLFDSSRGSARYPLFHIVDDDCSPGPALPLPTRPHSVSLLFSISIRCIRTPR